MVMRAPQGVGIPNRMCKAEAEPRTSYISDPIIAISMVIQRIYLVEIENYSAQSFAKFLYVTMPYLAAILW